MESNKTSHMMYPLQAPNGWFLLKAEHQHTKITYRGDTHVPVIAEGGAWYVEFQIYPHGGRAVSGRGHSLEQAWKNAAEAANEVSLKLMGGDDA